MILLVVAIVLIVGAGILRLDLAGIPTWVRTTLMVLVVVAVAAATVFVLAVNS